MIDIMEEPILVCDCTEPSGLVRREVRPLIFTPKNMKTFWEKAREHRTLFSDEINGDFKAFLEVFMTTDDSGVVSGRGLTWVVDDFIGVCYINHISTFEATVHYTFFDGRLRGRENLIRHMLRYVFDKYRFRRLNAEIPCYVKDRTKLFAEQLGFVREGRKRKSVMYKGELFDVYLYGLLNEELN